MVKLRVAVRVIPEDAYLSSVESRASKLPGEKKFPVIIRDPDEWYIGSLANEVASRYQKLYKRSVCDCVTPKCGL